MALSPCLLDDIGASIPMRGEKCGLAAELVCTECGAIAPVEADGWRGYLTSDEDEPAELAI